MVALEVRMEGGGCLCQYLEGRGEGGLLVAAPGRGGS